jgi:ribosomal protein S27E
MRLTRTHDAPLAAPPSPPVLTLAQTQAERDRIWTENVVRPRVVRCECRRCGAHANAVAAPGTQTSCPNCGDFRLVPVEGAEIILGAPLGDH